MKPWLLGGIGGALWIAWIFWRAWKWQLWFWRRPVPNVEPEIEEADRRRQALGAVTRLDAYRQIGVVERKRP